MSEIISCATEIKIRGLIIRKVDSETFSKVCKEVKNLHELLMVSVHENDKLKEELKGYGDIPYAKWGITTGTSFEILPEIKWKK